MHKLSNINLKLKIEVKIRNYRQNYSRRKSCCNYFILFCINKSTTMEAHTMVTSCTVIVEVFNYKIVNPIIIPWSLYALFLGLTRFVSKYYLFHVLKYFTPKWIHNILLHHLHKYKLHFNKMYLLFLLLL